MATPRCRRRRDRGWGEGVRFGERVRLPFRPFPGTIGVAPPEPGQHSIVPPRRWGGNLDTRHLEADTTLYLPVGVEGALFSVGDTHACQGDGEVCGTAIAFPALTRRIGEGLSTAEGIVGSDATPGPPGQR